MNCRLCKFWVSLIASVLCLVQAQASANDSTLVYVLDVRSEINTVSNRYIKLGFEEATEKKADLVILNMDTYGGAIADADDIRTRIMDYPKPVYVYINNTAGSAGALISIACDSIYMVKGGNIGAATAVNQNGEVLPEKIQSFMRSMMRTTAEANGRNPDVAAAMVGHNLSSDSAFVLSLTTKEAIDTGYCEAQVKSINEILKRTGFEGAVVQRYKPDNVESIIAVFLNPALKVLFVLMIFGGIYFELQTPGIGFPLAAAIVGLVLYFVPDYLHGLLEYWELLLFLVGVVLLAIEVFVIPGFGVVGASGIAFCMGSLVLSMLKNDAFDFDLVDSQQLLWALMIMSVSLVGGAVLFFVGGGALVKSKAFKRLSIETSIHENAMGNKLIAELIVGKEGVALTDLKPTGKIKIEGEHYDAQVISGYLEKGQAVVVVSSEGVTLKVKEI